MPATPSELNRDEQTFGDYIGETTRFLNWIRDPRGQAEELKTDGSAPGTAKSEIPDAKKAAWNTPKNVDDLAKLIMSEASVGNADERAAVGYTVLNRMVRNGASNVSDVWDAYAHNQDPTDEIKELAAKILRCDIPDNSGGATHYYSPRSMPMEGDATGGSDVGGGLEQTPGLPKKNYAPGWSKKLPPVKIPGARPSHFKFYRQPGSGKVK